MRVISLLLALAGVLALLLTGCNGGSSSNSAQVRLFVGDAPVVLEDGTTVDAVNVPIEQIVLLTQAENEGTGVVLYDGGDSPATIDLLDLANLSLTQLQQLAGLGTVSIPAGHYTQMRLVLGAGANAMLNGAPVDLKVPSGMQTGLKVNIDLDLAAGTLQDVLLDFNLSKLTYQPNQSRFILPPHALRLVSITQTANIAGTVTVTPPVAGLTGPVTVKLTLCDAMGNPILVNGVPDATIDTQVTIEAGQTTAAYTLNAIPSGSDYLLLPTVTYNDVELPSTLNPALPVPAPASGQTVTLDVPIVVE